MKNNFLKIVCLCFCFQVLSTGSISQNIAINNTGAPPSINAMLDVQSSSKGILIPRIDYNNRPKSGVDNGMLVYITNHGPLGNNRFYYYNGTQWLTVQDNENKQTLSLSNDTLRISSGNYVVVGDILNLIGYYNCGNGYTQVSSDQNNCGECGIVCPALANATHKCENGNCLLDACKSGYANCDDVQQNGCEINLNISLTNCGACNNACTVAHGTPLCLNATCSVGSCNAGYANCNGLYADGCETNTTSNPNHCGGCSRTCGAIPNGSAACLNSTCSIGTCNTGFGNCNGIYADGCETNTTSNPNHCGGCSRTCGAIPNGSAACLNSTCSIGTCNTGFGNCNGLYADGCEINLTNNSNHCGSCGTVCPTGKTCVSGLCK